MTFTLTRELQKKKLEVKGRDKQEGAVKLRIDSATNDEQWRIDGQKCHDQTIQKKKKTTSAN